MLRKLKESFRNIPIVKRGEYNYFVHPLTDGIPAIDPSLLREAALRIAAEVDWDEVDKIVTIEAMGIPLATALSLITDKPLNIVRKKPYGLPGEVICEQRTGYSVGKLHINGIKRGERILLVDIIVSTGGTMSAVIKGLEKAGAQIKYVYALMERGEGVKRIKEETGYDVRTFIRLEVDERGVRVSEVR